jgi:zinc transporter, ZIP family
VIEAFLWGLLGASALVLGAFVVSVRMPKPPVLGLIMGFGAGVLLSAVSFELVEEAVSVAGGLGSTASGLFTGALVFFAGDIAIGRYGKYRSRTLARPVPVDASPLAIVLGAALDGIPESAVLGLTLLETGKVSTAVLVAVFVSNVPEAIAASAGLLQSGWDQTRVYFLWAFIAVVSGIAAGLGFALLDGASPDVQAFVLAFAAGAILTMLSTSMMPEAYDHAGRAVGLATTLGFAIAYTISWVSKN